MRGHLRITSQRTPYLRGGLSWSVREPAELHIGELDGARFLELVGDPVLAITISDEHGAFRPLPAIAGDITVDQAQMMIDAIVSDAVSLAPLAASASSDGDAVDGVIADLRERSQRQADDCLRLGDELNSARGELVIVREQLAEAREGLATAAARENAHLDRIKGLEADLAAAKAKAKTPKPPPPAKVD